MDDVYFYLLLDKGDMILLDGEEKYLVADKDDESMTLKDLTSEMEPWRLPICDLEKFLWELDAESYLTVEYSEEKSAKYAQMEENCALEREVEYSFKEAYPDETSERYSEYADRLLKQDYSRGDGKYEK